MSSTPISNKLSPMDISMVSTTSDFAMKDASGDDFEFLDVDDTDNYSDEGSLGSDSDDDSDDDAELDAAEEFLKNLSQNSLKSTGTIGRMYGKPADDIKERMMKKSLQHMQQNVMANSSSVADIQALVRQHIPQPKETGVANLINMKRSNSSVLEYSSVGHIGQSVSAQKTVVDDNAIHPDEHLAKLLGCTCQRYPYDSLEGFFLPSTPESQKVWTNELTKAVREHNLAALQKMHSEGQFMQASNNFGETIVHLVVRRGTPEMLRFLLQDAGVSMLVCCDMGRTPMHDAAWNLSSDSASYQKMALLLTESPMQLMITDKRGYTPLAYVPRIKWAECNAFLDRQFAKGRFKSLIMK